MASKDKKSSKKENKKASKGIGDSITDTAADFIGEVEKAGETLAAEIKHLFDGLTDKVSDVANTAAETTVSVAGKVSDAANAAAETAISVAGKVSDAAGSAAESTSSAAGKVAKEPADLLRGIVAEVTEAGESSLRTVGERFDALRQTYFI